MKNLFFGLTAVPLLALGAQSQNADLGAVLSVKQTCAFVSGSAAEFLRCDTYEQSEFDGAFGLPVSVSFERNTEQFDPEEMPLWCDRQQCYANTGPFRVTLDYGYLRNQGMRDSH
ncbi:hypothetical protein [Stenotrophomonas sp. GD03654]|uniref:hypothetical protein n=1 Tax=Stenotrophomonas sp. GD03654 TaxID=2975362 RepID=UPI00244A6EA2|nr:hypothetical protein [Stenotrophomonas sp. GD03654]MDH2177964.1 hypothetical protein [Stenotrophomonas sp. GD03654]